MKRPADPLAYCIEQARKIPVEKGQQRVYGMVMTSKGYVLGEGSNSYSKTHPRNYHYTAPSCQYLKPYLHAEQRAILRASKRSTRRNKMYKVVVARVWKDGSESIYCSDPKQAIVESMKGNYREL